jgi:hypothetical protein
VSLDDGAFWIRRPVICREKGCNQPVVWAALFGPAGEAPRVEGTCDDHADPRWNRPVTACNDEILVLAVKIGEPKRCALRPDGDLCGNPEDHVAIYITPEPEGVRLGPACSACLEAAAIHIEQDRALIVPPQGDVPLERMFGAPAATPWWGKQLIDPELGAIIGPDTVDLLSRVIVTWADLILNFCRAFAIAIITVLAMAFVPRGGWWLLLGGVAPFIGIGIGALVGIFRVRKWAVSDGQHTTHLDGDEVVTTLGEHDDGSPYEIRVDRIVAALSFFVVFVGPGLLYASALILLGGGFGASYGDVIADAGALMIAAFVATGAVLAGLCTAGVWLCWNGLLIVPVLLANYFWRDK